MLTCLLVAGCGAPHDAAEKRPTRDLETLVRNEIASDEEDWSGDGLFGPVKLNILKASVPGTALTLIYPYGGRMCGSGGCSLFVVEQNDDGVRIIGRTAQVLLPVKRVAGGSSAHPDFSVFLRGYGELGTRVRLAYAAGRYPGNASLPPAHRLPDDGDGLVLLDYPRATSQ
ncbi:hypothetical protein [Sphingopyxis sp. H115]|uniref:hypothetical protein n=1 Tax=Sphingopyxis sp. H115 TaxID=1759073 RepID=UPI00128EE011|nr:hypothetical protein [Sphingopyxis sp. H115]